MATCGYYSSAKQEVCLMPFGHKKRHFNYEGEPPARFSVKKHKAAETKPPAKPQYCWAVPVVRRSTGRVAPQRKK